LLLLFGRVDSVGRVEVPGRFVEDEPGLPEDDDPGLPEEDDPGRFVFGLLLLSGL